MLGLCYVLWYEKEVYAKHFQAQTLLKKINTHLKIGLFRILQQ